jgi:hypothetical protein
VPNVEYFHLKFIGRVLDDTSLYIKFDSPNYEGKEAM